MSRVVLDESENHMLVSREKAAESRERIVETAARMFCEEGFDGVSVRAIMSAAGLTHGGFYGHFRSKDDLVAEAVTRALQHGVEQQIRYTNLGDLVSDYLSRRHCADCANGCAVAALGGDIVRQGEPVRGALTAFVRGQVDRLSRLLGSGIATSRRRRAIATLAGMVGALILARAVNDYALSEEILGAARAAFGGPRPRAGGHSAT
jgi:TetR/AcrR family transcriptional repressor of nem operon